MSTQTATLRSEILARISQAPEPFYPDRKVAADDPDWYREKLAAQLNNLRKDPNMWSKYVNDVEPKVDVTDIAKNAHCGLGDINWSRNHIVKNSYGAGILITTQLAMVDIDRGDPQYDQHAGLLTRDSHDVTTRVQRLIETDDHRGLLEGAPVDQYIYRVYQTHGGWRVLIIPPRYGRRASIGTSGYEYEYEIESLKPDGMWYRGVSLYLGGDWRYATLCEQQRNWRIRLTHKPWCENEESTVARFICEYQSRACSDDDGERDSGDSAVQSLVTLHDSIACWEFDGRY